MGGTKPRGGRSRHRHALLGNGIAALVVGAVCLVLSLLPVGLPALRALAPMLRIPAAVGLGLGAVLLMLHASARRHPRAGERAQATDAGALALHAPIMPMGWDVDVLDRLDARHFQAVCELLFAQAGFITRPQRGRTVADDDLWLYSRHAPGAATVVRCRLAAGAAVSVEELCDFYAILVAHEMKRGTYATPSRFGADASQFAAANRINLLDGERLLAVIATRTPQQQRALLAAACERVC